MIWLLISLGVPCLAGTLELSCASCSGQESRYYAMNQARSEDRYHALSRISDCLRDIHERQFRSLVSLQELRNVFEITGRFFAFETLYQHRERVGDELEYVRSAVESGRWEGAWPIGARDCETHAKKLKKHLDGLFRARGVGDDFVVQVVNSYPNVAATDAVANPLPGSNHYLVRIVSLRTGRSYTGDVYTGVSVSREDDSGRIILNDYEACFFNEVTRQRYGAGISDGGVRAIAASFTPLLRTELAQQAKQAARACIGGEREARLSTD